MILGDKVALVTGASRGIGAAIAKTLGKEGASVILNYQRGVGNPGEVATAIIKSGSEVIALEADLTKKEEVDAMVAAGVSSYSFAPA